MKDEWATWLPPYICEVVGAPVFECGWVDGCYHIYIPLFGWMVID